MASHAVPVEIVQKEEDGQHIVMGGLVQEVVKDQKVLQAADCELQETP